MKKLLGFLLGFILIASTTFSGSMTSVTNPGGADTQVQFNNAGAFGGDSDMTFVTDTLTSTNISVPANGFFLSGTDRFMFSPVVSNTYIGNSAGVVGVDTAINNTIIGYTAGDSINNTDADANTMVGAYAGTSITTGSENTIVGAYAGQTLTTGMQNVIIGQYAAGSTLTTGSGNVWIGNRAGLLSASNTLWIDNSDTQPPIIYGDLANNRLCINCMTPTARFHLPAGIATAGYAPLKFTSGTNLTTPEAGAIEYNGTELFFSPSTVRHTVVKSAAASATPTVTGFGTSPSVVTSNGTHAFTINVGTGGTASTGTITLPTATTAWVCNMWDVTNPDSFNTKMTGGTATTVTVTNYSMTTGNAIAWTASDILRVSCIAY